MNRILISAGLTGLLLASCSSTASVQDDWRSETWSSSRSTRISGIVGFTDITALNLQVDPGVGSVVRDDTLTIPLLAAQMQTPARQSGPDWGFEAGFSVGFGSDRDAVLIDTGALLISSDNDVRLVDFSGGLYYAKTLGGKVRVYGGAGPLLQFGQVDLELAQPIGGSDKIESDGFGYGYYTRAGIEWQTQPGTSMGFVVRWVDSKMEMSGRLDDLELEGLQVGFVVTTGF